MFRTLESDIKKSTPRGLRVTVVDEELPFPLTTGKRLRTWNLLSRLATRHKITFLAHASSDPGEQADAVAHMEKAGIHCNVLPHRLPRHQGPSFYARLLANLRSPLPYSVETHASGPMREAVQQRVEDGDTDVWHVEWTPYAELFRDLVVRPVVVSAHNVESVIWRRYELNETNLAKRAYIAIQRRKYERFEKWAFERADRVVTVAENDANVARQEFGASVIDVVDNGVDTDLFEDRGDDRSPGTILFLGSLDYRPNLDAVRYLLDDIFPRVRELATDTRLIIVGRRPPQWLRRRMARLPDVELYADVPDVRPFLHQASVMAVPLRIGGGSRLKILEALACKLPVVSTTVGAEGLDLKSDVHLQLTDDVEQMARALATTSRDPASARDITQQGYATVRSQYDWDILATRLEHSWCRAVDGDRCASC